MKQGELSEGEVLQRVKRGLVEVRRRGHGQPTEAQAHLLLAQLREHGVEVRLAVGECIPVPVPWAACGAIEPSGSGVKCYRPAGHLGRHGAPGSVQWLTDPGPFLDYMAGTSEVERAREQRRVSLFRGVLDQVSDQLEACPPESGCRWPECGRDAGPCAVVCQGPAWGRQRKLDNLYRGVIERGLDSLFGRWATRDVVRSIVENLESESAFARSFREAELVAAARAGFVAGQCSTIGNQGEGAC